MTTRTATSKLTLRQYLTRKAIDAGTTPYDAVAALQALEVEHPEWDMDQVQTLEQWDNDR